MTREELSQWIEQHYDELGAVVNKRIIARQLECDPLEILHYAISTMLSSKILPRVREHNYDLDKRYVSAWNFAMLPIKQAISNHIRHLKAQGRLIEEAKNLARAGALHGRTGGGRQTSPPVSQDEITITTRGRS